MERIALPLAIGLAGAASLEGEAQADEPVSEIEIELERLRANLKKSVEDRMDFVARENYERMRSLDVELSFDDHYLGAVSVCGDDRVQETDRKGLLTSGGFTQECYEWINLALSTAETEDQRKQAQKILDELYRYFRPVDLEVSRRLKIPKNWNVDMFQPGIVHPSSAGYEFIRIANDKLSTERKYVGLLPCGTYLVGGIYSIVVIPKYLDKEKEYGILKYELIGEVRKENRKRIKDRTNPVNIKADSLSEEIIHKTRQKNWKAVEGLYQTKLAMGKKAPFTKMDHKYGAIAARESGDMEKAYQRFALALELDPYDMEIKSELDFIRTNYGGFSINYNGGVVSLTHEGEVPFDPVIRHSISYVQEDIADGEFKGLLPNGSYTVSDGASCSFGFDLNGLKDGYISVTLECPK